MTGNNQLYSPTNVTDKQSEKKKQRQKAAVVKPSQFPLGYTSQGA